MNSIAKRVRSNRKDHDFFVAVSLCLRLVVVLAFVSSGIACKDDGEGTADAAADAMADVSSDAVPSTGSCSGAAPMGECAQASNGCCDDVARTMPLECRNGRWSCPTGQTLFQECCGVGHLCQPYPGGGSAPSPMCAPRCQQVEGRWYCGSVIPDGGVDGGHSLDGATGG